jgi:hypothetical protein
MASALGYSRTQLPSGATASGVLHVNTTSVGTDAALTEKDLWSYSLDAPAVLNANGRSLRVTVQVFFANTATVKTVRLYLGTNSVTLNSTGSPQNAVGLFTTVITRTGAATQRMFTGGVAGTTIQAAVATSSWNQNLGAALTLKVTGQNGTANANDIILQEVIVEAF